jgi:mono/diheme cytochrome c family protein
MQKLFHLIKNLWLIAVIILADASIISGQTEKKQQFPIPKDISKIFQTSCLPCHGKDGGRLPKSTLNFSRWSGYDGAKQVEKASSICKSIMKGTMPPKSSKDSSPQIILTNEQIDLICNWSENMKLKKKNTKK